jgi:ADP-ribose pyrophosphatase YjhB (NUDIX family)
MKNFSVKINGKEYWISRSCAVVCLIIDDRNQNAPKIVAVKRGKGCPDEVGKWNLVCGYISYDETIKEASSRETKEETGLNIPSNAWKMINVNSDPKSDKRQNITFRMLAKWKPEYGTEFTTEFSEPDEVDEVRWISLEDVDNLDWAFNHKQLVNTYLKEKIKS